MDHTPLHLLITALLIALLSFSATGCLPAKCDPNSPYYEGESCRSIIEDILYKANILAWGSWSSDWGSWSSDYGDRETCFSLLRCTVPYCMHVEENGSFETGTDRWSGDLAGTKSALDACLGTTWLRFQATTPAGASASPSAQVFQVFPYSSMIPEAARANVRRVRAQAFFSATVTNDDQFGLHIAAYAGNPSAFPAQGDPDTFPENTASYQRLAISENTLFHDADGLPWQGLLTTMMLPESTDFFVVLLQAYENVSNESVGTEFPYNRVDNVQVGLDTGNTRPFALDDQATTDEEVPVEIRVLNNDRDVDSRIDAATLLLVRAPGDGTASISAPDIVTYTPNADYFGTDQFSYTVADDEGISSGNATVTVEVRPVNDAPVAAGDVYQRQGNTPLTIDAPGVLGNDTDVENDTLTAVLVDDVNNGTLALGGDGSFIYTPDPGFLGDDTFTYRAHDGTDDSDVATVRIQRITIPNQPPTANDDAAQTIFETPVIIDVLANDTDSDGVLDPSTVTVTSGPSDGTVTVLANGRIEYTPNTNFGGFDEFTYTVADDEGAVSNEASVVVEVIG